MPLVRLAISVAGIAKDGVPFDWQPGDEVEMTPEQAAVWTAEDRGEIVRPHTTPETPEHNAARRGAARHTPETRVRA